MSTANDLIEPEMPNRTPSRCNILLGGTTLAAASALPSGHLVQLAQAQDAPAPSGRAPNILVIWGDDIGMTHLSVYSLGLMGFRRPNIDRIARDGIIFTDYYGEQSCTAGRSAFITGQSVFRTGLSKVGLPGASLGLQMEDPTIAELLKPLGYATGQFGKNHLGDRNGFLPTVHGFDEFYGNLYHLNAEEEPELPDYPKPADFPNFRERFGPRGVIHSFAIDVDDPTVDPRFGRVGTQRIEDTGPLTRKRMETIDDDIAVRAAGFIETQARANKPFFCWVNFTHMHFRTHAKPSSVGQAGRWQSIYHDVMIDHDKNVGTVLDKIDQLGLASDTIVFYSTDNGPHMNTWPDGAMTPFRNEKNSNWEGAFRVPAMVRWPGRIRPGSISNEIMSHLDWLPTLLAAGVPDIKGRLINGHRAGDLTYKVHLDGYNFLPHLTGQEAKSPRVEYFYISDDGDLMNLRYDNWKPVFAIQPAPGTLAVWQTEFEHPRIPYIYNLRTDPFERATITSNTYYDWEIDHSFMLVPAQGLVAQFLATFRDYPPRQKAASFTIQQILEKMNQPGGD